MDIVERSKKAHEAVCHDALLERLDERGLLLEAFEEHTVGRGAPRGARSAQERDRLRKERLPCRPERFC
jgi:hypothetical protein